MVTKEKSELRKKHKKFLNATESVDSKMVNESIDNYLIPDVEYKDMVCLDLGANIGGFIKIAIDSGAKEVVAIECDARNFKKLSESFKDVENVLLIEAAVSNINEPTVKLYKSGSKNNHCSTSIIQKTALFKEYDEVRNVLITDLLEEYKPDIVKIDIEGAEYGILDAVIEYKPDFLFVELHVGKVKHHLNGAIEKLKKAYEKHDIKPLIFFDKIGGYDCWFKK